MQREKTTLSVRHLTTYRYAQPVELGEHRMMLRPRDGHDQRLVSSPNLTIEPEPSRIRWLYDVFDNCVALASFAGATTSLSIRGRFTVDRTADDSPGGEIDPRARHYPFAYLPRSCPTSRVRSSASIPTRRATSSAGRTSSSIRAARPRPAIS